MPGTETPNDSDVRREERDIYLIILGAMVPIVVGTALTHGVFNGGATICLIMLALAIFGLFATVLVRRRNRLPRARTRSSR
ncbi:MAG TPA: hypothetical protein VGM90_33575 [Kofleriaceae bacterium]|jgi:predicted membrane channel-forming protein YqfA (hemolysin III family)